jgi:hypothetical protein
VELAAVTYHIDHDNRIVYLREEGWTSFARRNQGKGLEPESMIGESLSYSISDPITYRIYLTLIRAVRRSQRARNISFRCDSPDARRVMDMRIFPVMSDGVGFKCELVKLEPRSRLHLLDHDTPRSRDRMAMCSWCKKVESVPFEWIEAEVAERRLLRDGGPLPEVVHKTCPTCARYYLSLAIHGRA